VGTLLSQYIGLAGTLPYSARIPARQMAPSEFLDNTGHLIWQDASSAYGKNVAEWISGGVPICLMAD
jgi:hypothetical protein